MVSESPCRFVHNSAAVAIFTFSRGCICFPDDREQALCIQHIVGATPLGSMELVKDLTKDDAFTGWWNGK